MLPGVEESEIETLDVRSTPPKLRHETIFDRLDGLAIGETLRSVNDG